MVKTQEEWDTLRGEESATQLTWILTDVGVHTKASDPGGKKI